jgi:microcystin-dependent protein
MERLQHQASPTLATKIPQIDTNGLHILSQKPVRYYDADNSHYVELKAASTVSANVTLTLPTSDGDADQFLKTDGSGNLSFATPPTGAFVPTGSVFCMAMITAPSGYLECDGSAVSRTTYADLFAAIGTTWGAGNGSSTFNVPDLRGEFVRGWDNGRGVDSGRTFASFQDHQLQEHSHQVNYNDQNVGDPPNPITIDNIRHTGKLDTTTTSGPTGNFGSETRPRNIAMMYVIKT